ncbi:MAG TPA: DHA2 family efflux MFS transporter permease subunit [Saprospiraceae bacterium]|nr:DHA2 family efflux MFS transporter permease subunit [Saprospiraceae bacterium]
MVSTALTLPAQPAYPTGFTKWIVVITAITCAVLELIDVTIVNVSLREISGSIGATTTEIAWVITAYAISNVIIIPLTSMLSDLFGRKVYFTASVLIFTFASLMCGLSNSLWTLVFWRFIQGLGGGGLLSTAQTIIIGSFPPNKISTANAIFGVGMIMGPTFGPTLGGYITDHISWHWIFFVNIPIGVIAAILSWAFITNRPGAVKPKKIDWWGMFFLAVTVGSIQYVLEEGTSKDWFESKEIVILSITALFGLLAFIHRELSIDYPAVNIRLYGNYNLAMGSVMNMILGMLLYGTVFIFPLLTQISLGWTALKTGLFMIPGALCTALAMPIVARLLAKGINPKTIIILGVIFTCGFVMMLGFTSPDSNEYNFYFPFVLRGFGLAFMMSPILALAVGGLRGADMAQAVGLANMVRQLGGAFGIALINLYLIHMNAQTRGNMLGYINIYDTQSADRLNTLTQNYQNAGYSLDEASALAYRALEGMLFKQQSIVAYNHGFMMIGLTILLCIPVVFLLRYKKAPQGANLSGAH